MPTEARTARDVVAQLIDHARADGRDAKSGAASAAATAFERMSAELSRWVGTVGCHALLKQALRQASDTHPVLSKVGLVSGSHARTSGSYPSLDRLAESVEVHSAKEITAGLEAALVVLFELLDRLIGYELSIKLAEASMTTSVFVAAKSEDERAR
jgi:hypothetical protein